jgi:hypothetical protein
MKRFWTAGIIGLLLVGGSVWGQLSQSGGAGSTVSAAQSGSWLMGITQGGNTATVSAGGALKVDGSAVTQPVSGTLTAVEKTACGSTTYDSGMVTMPNTSTAVTSTATCVNAVIFVNTTASVQTITLSDNQNTPVSYLSSFQVPANSTLVYDLHFARLANGIKWQATNASAVNAQIVGLQ